MPLVFHTPREHPYDVEIAGVGTVGGQNRGGIPVEHAAAVLHELQDDDGKPLTGAKLEKAANAFAAGRGLAVKSLKNIDEEKLRVEAGAFPAGPKIEEVAWAIAERDRGNFIEHSENPAAAPLAPADVLVTETDVLPPQPTPDNPTGQTS